MSITDEVVKIIESFKPIDLDTNIDHPIVNYKTQTNNYHFHLIEIDDYSLNQVANKITDKILAKLKTEPEKKKES